MSAEGKVKRAAEALARLPLLHTQDLMDILGVHERTIYRWRQEGVLPPPVYVGSTPYWRPEEFLRWLWGGCADRRRKG